METPVATPLMIEIASTQTLFVDLGATTEPSEGTQETVTAKSQSSVQGTTGAPAGTPNPEGT